MHLSPPVCVGERELNLLKINAHVERDCTAGKKNLIAEDTESNFTQRSILLKKGTTPFRGVTNGEEAVNKFSCANVPDLRHYGTFRTAGDERYSGDRKRYGTVDIDPPIVARTMANAFLIVQITSISRRTQ